MQREVRAERRIEQEESSVGRNSFAMQKGVANECLNQWEWGMCVLK